MKGDTPLDYAVFQLNESRSRCELWICAGERNEKLASGSFKPFLANLRAAKEQLGKAASFIILQAPPLVGDGSPWFTKRTVEMFVRFVTTPDVLETVSMLEAELLKLVDASSILVSDSSKSWASVPITPRTAAIYKSEVERIGDQSKTYARRSSLDYGGVALDGSKRDLLKALETRKSMLLSEQKKAFAHAVAAGFNVACISDLMVFANCFGAPRLWEACLKFMTSCKKQQEGIQGTVVDNATSSCSIELAATGSESSSNSVNSKSKSRARKTWDPQVMVTLQQLHSRKVENGSFMSPARKKVHDENCDEVMGVRESVSNQVLFAEEDRRISVQAAINLFESKQKQVEDLAISKRKPETGQPQNTTTVDDIGKLEVPTASMEADDDLESILLEESPATLLPVHFGIFKPNKEEQPVKQVEETDEWKPGSVQTFDDMFLEHKKMSTDLQSSRRQSLCNWTCTNWDSDLEMDGSSKENGGFLERYQERRQAKFKHEPNLRKAERDAKLKAMHDVLEKRKAEMTTSKLLKKEVALRKSSPNPSGVHSAPLLRNENGMRNKSSPKSSTTTTPRLSVQSSSQNRIPRRVSEGVQGKENLAPPDAGDKKTKQRLDKSHTKIPQRNHKGGSPHSRRGQIGNKLLEEKPSGSETCEPSTHEPAETCEPSTHEPAEVCASSTLEPAEVCDSSTPEPAEVCDSSTPEPAETCDSSSPEPAEACDSSTPEPAESSIKTNTGDDDHTTCASVELSGIKLDGDDAESSCSCATSSKEVQVEQEEGHNSDKDDGKAEVIPEEPHESIVDKMDHPVVMPEEEEAVEFTFVPEESSARGDDNLNKQLVDDKVAITSNDEEAKAPVIVPVTTMDEVVLKWHQNNGDKAPPLFELAQLDYKMASRVPLVSISSSSNKNMESSMSDSSSAAPVESFGSNKSQTCKVWSEPVSPKQMPLFDLLEQQAKLPSCKSQSRLLPQCDNSSSKKLSASVSSSVIPEMKPKETTLKGLKRFLRFGRSKPSSSSSSDKKIMWQNGSFV